MTPYYSDEWLTIIEGDCRTVLPTLPADSVDCVVTSPPYWGLRDYGTATWVGGEPECPHRVAATGSTMNKGNNNREGKPFPAVCGRCGASRSDFQLGLERTPEEYVANMVAVFAEVRRVLKPSGTCWLNLGDSYAGSWGAQSRGNFPSSKSTLTTNNGRGPKAGDKYSALSVQQIAAAPKGTNTGSWVAGHPTLKPKDLVGIPWRVAFALQADGWYLRSDIIWSKPNPMPESVTDRPTKSHEYLFLLTKSARYYFDNEAVREPEKPWNGGRINAPKLGPERIHGAGAAGTTSKTFDVVKGANIRSVWTIATRPYPGAHFAVFPPELPERCIKAGSSERGVCPECGAPWERTTEKSRTFESGSGRAGHLPVGKNGANLQGGGETLDIRRGPVISTTTTGWRPTCGCVLVGISDGGSGDLDGGGRVLRAAGYSPAVVLDPFAGSGTVGMVANRLSRRAILIDLNPEYLRQQMTRNAQTPLGLSEGVA